MTRPRRTTWWAYDGTLQWGVNACGQIVELRGHDGRWSVSIWTPLMDLTIGPFSAHFARSSVALAAYSELMKAAADELGPTVADQIRMHWAMRLHPSWDHDAEERP